jgi:hypothetical protein
VEAPFAPSGPCGPWGPVGPNGPAFVPPHPALLGAPGPPSPPGPPGPPAPPAPPKPPQLPLSNRQGIDSRFPVTALINVGVRTRASGARKRPSVLLGLNVLGGMEHEAELQMEEERTVERYRGTHDHARHANLDACHLNVLAVASAIAATQ